MKKKLIVWIEEETIEKLKEIAVNSKRSLSSTTCQLIEQSLSPIQSGIEQTRTDPHSSPSASDPLERNSLSSDLLERLSVFLDKTPQLLEDMDLVKECAWNMDCGLSAEWYRSDAAMVEYLKARGCSIEQHKRHRLPPGPKGWKPPEW